MHVALVLAQIDATRRTITAIVFALLAVAAALALLTAWYWRITDPRRQGGPKRTPPPRRRRADRGSPPEVDPSPGGATAIPTSVGAPPLTAPGKDQTRVMDRNAILDGPQAPEARGSTSAPIIHQPPVSPASAPEANIDPPEATIDLREPDLREPDRRESDRRETTPPSPSDHTPIRGRVGSGAHDEGLSLEEWLASGEED